MKLLTIFLIVTGAMALAMKIYLQFKLLAHRHRNLGEFTRYFGIDFFLPVITRFDSRHMRNRKAQANRMLVIFYVCFFVVGYLVIMKYTDL